MASSSSGHLLVGISTVRSWVELNLVPVFGSFNSGGSGCCSVGMDIGPVPEANRR